MQFAYCMVPFIGERDDPLAYLPHCYKDCTGKTVPKAVLQVGMI